MNLNTLADLHTHTNFSPDAESTPEQMCDRAAELRLAAYAITDHCDCNFWYPLENCESTTATDAEMYGAGKYANASIDCQTALKEKYSGRLNLLCGIELGQPLQDPERAEEIASRPVLDFIIGSHHQNAGENDFYWIEYDKLDSSEIYRLLDDYFCQVYEMSKWGKFDVLGHLTYPLRYICGEYGIDIDMKRYDDVIREIFCTLIHSGKGIEINTSGLRQKYGLTFPTLDYIKLYRELGGEIITLGSDAHCAADIGKGIFEGAELAKAAGFKYISYFKERKPTFMRLG